MTSWPSSECSLRLELPVKPYMSEFLLLHLTPGRRDHRIQVDFHRRRSRWQTERRQHPRVQLTSVPDRDTVELQGRTPTRVPGHHVSRGDDGQLHPQRGGKVTCRLDRLRPAPVPARTPPARLGQNTGEHRSCVVGLPG